MTFGVFFSRYSHTYIQRRESRSKLPKCDEEVFTRFLIAARPINSERRPRERPGHPRRSHNLTHFLFSSMSSSQFANFSLFQNYLSPPPAGWRQSCCGRDIVWGEIGGGLVSGRATTDARSNSVILWKKNPEALQRQETRPGRVNM